VLLLGPTGAGKSFAPEHDRRRGGEQSRPCYGPRQPTRFSTRAQSDTDRIVASGRLGAVAKDRLKLAAAPASADGVAVIDAPDIDSVERDNRELADLLVEACDLCVFVTTATRYADLVPWEVLRRVRDRGLRSSLC